MTYEIIDGVYQGPKVYPDSLDLSGINITSLGCLEMVEGSLDIRGSSVKTLGLKDVLGHLNLSHTPLKDLGCLVSVGGTLDIRGTSIRSLGSLRSAWGFYASEELEDLGEVEYIRGVMFLQGQNMLLGHLKELLSDFDKVPVEDYPKYIDDPNVLIRNKVKKYYKESLCLH